MLKTSDVLLEPGSVLESDSSPYFEDSDLDSDSNPCDVGGSGPHRLEILETNCTDT